MNPLEKLLHIQKITRKMNIEPYCIYLNEEEVKGIGQFMYLIQDFGHEEEKVNMYYHGVIKKPFHIFGMLVASIKK